MATIGGQFKQVLRRLRRAPVFTAITLITLAAGIGANTAVFSVLQSVLLKPLPYPQPEQLAAVRLTAPGINIKDFELSPSDYFIFREQSTTFQDIGMYQGDSVSVTGTAEPERVDALIVTDGMLPLLGIPPMLGRVFSKADDSRGARHKGRFAGFEILIAHFFAHGFLLNPDPAVLCTLRPVGSTPTTHLPRPNKLGDHFYRRRVFQRSGSLLGRT
jgi:MacB-like periplasmic core domain